MVWMFVAHSWPACPLMWQLWPRRGDRSQVQTLVPACTSADGQIEVLKEVFNHCYDSNYPPCLPARSWVWFRVKMDIFVLRPQVLVMLPMSHDCRICM